mgnify:FL=1
MKKCGFLIICAAILLTTSCSSMKTSPAVTAQFAEKVENRNYTVKMNYANPMRMRPVYLSSEYTLQVKGDSAIAFLPYYGVAHVAPFDPSEGGIKFAQPMTNYKIESNKNQTGWNITFRVKSNQSVYDVFISAFQNGSCSVSVNSYERDMISFQGEIMN